MPAILSRKFIQKIVATCPTTVLMVVGMAKNTRRRISVQISDKLEKRLESVCKRHAKTIGSIVRYCLVSQLPAIEKAQNLSELI